jgi:type I restriction enzyme S subunit
MKSEPSWQSATLGDIVDLRSGKALPDDLRDADGPYPVMGANGEYGRSVRPLEEVPIITIGRVGASYGAVHRTHGPAWVADNALIARPSGDSDFLFAYYLLQTCDFSSVVSGSSQALLTQRAIASIPVAIPPPRQQIHIAAVLGALDDKIDSNRRLASLLNETATAVFRAQFVDFVGRERLEETKIGPIPPGWRTGSLTTLARFVNGKAFTKEANAKGRPILRIKELNSGIRDDTPRTDMVTADEHVARHHDILFAWSGSLSAYRWSGPESLINQHIFKVIPEGYPPWFVYQWVRHHMAEFQAIARDKATTMGHIQRRHLSEAIVALPDSQTLASVSDVLDPVDQMEGALFSEIASLTAIRSALLPKLIAGEIRVPVTCDPEEVVGPEVERLAGARP